MKQLFIDCSCGVAGDMLIASLICHLDSTRQFLDVMSGINIDGLKLLPYDTMRNSIKVKGFEVETTSVQPLRHLSDIVAVINSSNINDTVKTKAIAVFNDLALAEAKVHGCAVEEIHFHELGAVDTVIDVVGFFVLLELLGIDEVIHNNVNVGSGYVNCEHGRLSVPAPAVTELLVGKNIYMDEEDGERTTPTGAVLIRNAKQSNISCGNMLSCGYGCGKKEYRDGNCLRTIILESDDRTSTEDVVLLECNIDDMTAEYLGFAVERILLAGALDVWQQPIYMKKNRLGTKLSVLCKDEEKFIGLIFKHTTTLGVRIQRLGRAVRGESVMLAKKGITYKQTGEIIKAEYEDLRLKAIEKDSSLFDIVKMLKD